MDQSCVHHKYSPGSYAHLVDPHVPAGPGTEVEVSVWDFEFQHTGFSVLAVQMVGFRGSGSRVSDSRPEISSNELTCFCNIM